MGMAGAMISESFARLSDSLGLNATLRDKAWALLQTAYSEPHRHYHTLSHIEAVVAQFEALRSKFTAPDAMLLALFFHDLVYDAVRSDNEARSAEQMRDLLSDAVDEAILGKACDAILATKHHTSVGDADIDLMVDIDMSIVAAPWPDYLAYAEGVAREYMPVYGEAYAAGRAGLFLLPTLQHAHIFLTESYRRREDEARANLKAELEMWLSGAFAERLKSGL